MSVTSNYNLPCSESAVERVLDVDDIEATNVLLTVNNDTGTTHVTATSDHDDVASVKLDKIGYLAGLDVELDSVVDLDQGIRVANGATIVGDNVWDTLGTNTGLADLEQLVSGLLSGDSVDGEAALDIVEETEVLARLLNGNNICVAKKSCKYVFPLSFWSVRTHEASRVGWVGADLAVDLNKALHDN